MSRPPRDPASAFGGTYFITSSTLGKRPLFRLDELAKLWIDTLYSYRANAKYYLHEFTLMPDHFHLLMTPRQITIERALQLVKGGFSYRVKAELKNNTEIWQRGFGDHRIRNTVDYRNHRTYIWQNAVERRLVTAPEHYPYCSAFPGYETDPPPAHLSG